VVAATISPVYSEPIRQRALALLRHGASVSEVSRALGVSRSTIRDWRQHTDRSIRRGACPRCEDARLEGEAYAALLGFYLGDGCISPLARYYALRVSCDAQYPAIVADVTKVLIQVRPGMTAFHVRGPGTIVVQAHWKHWPCLFPQHGPGRKHERPIVLERWQVEVVEQHPAAFLRGLFHSDGCRANNWTRKIIAGEPKRYEYPRWQFSNNSDDIRRLCCWALDLVDVAWRRSNATTISVSRRADVSRLDELIGLKA
jgi:hypothetical protein